MSLPRPRLVPFMRARPRLLAGAAVGVLAYLALPSQLAAPHVTRWLVAWDAGMFLYVVLASWMMAHSAHDHMRARAAVQDEGQWVIMALVVVSSVANLVAIGAELAWVKDLHGLDKAWHAGLAGLTVLLSWAFIQVMFTLHYAHHYYASHGKRQSPGLLFPQEDEPHYGDFFYFAAVIGTSGQTADVAFVSKSMRRLGTVHCILSYLFNTTVLALLINIGASLF